MRVHTYNNLLTISGFFCCIYRDKIKNGYQIPKDPIAVFLSYVE